MHSRLFRLADQWRWCPFLASCRWDLLCIWWLISAEKIWACIWSMTQFSVRDLLSSQPVWLRGGCKQPVLLVPCHHWLRRRVGWRIHAPHMLCISLSCVSHKWTWGMTIQLLGTKGLNTLMSKMHPVTIYPRTALSSCLVKHPHLCWHIDRWTLHLWWGLGSTVTSLHTSAIKAAWCLWCHCIYLLWLHTYIQP